MKKTLSLSFSALLASTALSSAALIAHYTFDEGTGTTAADSAGGDQNATTNQGTVGWTATGKIGGALDLPGNASMIAPDGLGAGTTALTVSGWVNMDDTPGYDGIFQSRGGTGQVWGLNVRGGNAADERFEFRYPNQSGASIGFGTANGSAVVGTWTHIAMTWTTDGTTATGFTYLDGALVDSLTTPADPLILSYDSYTNWNIGDDPCCGGRELNAQLDDVAVWDEELSAADIQKIFDGGNAGLDAPTALLVPEPSATLFALLGGLLVFRRRR